MFKRFFTPKLVVDDIFIEENCHAREDADYAALLQKGTGYSVGFKEKSAWADVVDFFNANNQRLAPLDRSSVERYKRYRSKPSFWQKFKIAWKNMLAIDFDSKGFLLIPLFIAGYLLTPYVLAHLLNLALWYEVNIWKTFWLFVIGWTALFIGVCEDNDALETLCIYTCAVGGFLTVSVWGPVSLLVSFVTLKIKDDAWEVIPIKKYTGKLTPDATLVTAYVANTLKGAKIEVESFSKNDKGYVSEGFVRVVLGDAEPVYLTHFRFET